MKHLSRIMLFVVVMTLIPISLLPAQTEVESRFLPEKKYDVTIRSTMDGSDGVVNVPTHTSTQRMHIETGAETSAGIPVEMTVYRIQQDNEAATDQVEWTFRFVAAADGAIGDLTVASAAEESTESLAFAMLSRMLDPVLFKTDYALRRANQDRIILGNGTPRDGAGEFIDFDYTVDVSETERQREAMPLATDIDGTALYNTAEQFFVERTQKETNRIYIAADEMGDEKNITMRKETSVTVRIADR
jgi:hypothetical protein